MKKRYLYITIIVSTIFMLVLFMLNAYVYIQVPIIVSWILLYNKFDQKRVLLYILFLVSAIELFTLIPIGIFGVSFFVTLLILEIFKDLFIFLRSSENLGFFLFGLCCNTILFSVLLFIMNSQFNILALLVSAVANIILFLLLTLVITKQKTSGYVT